MKHDFKVRNQFCFTLTPEDCETIDPVSKTVKGDSYSIKELVERFANGQNVNVGRNVDYHGDQFDDIDLRTVRDADLVDQTALVGDLTQTIADIKKKEAKKKEPTIDQQLEALEKQKAALEAQRVEPPKE